MCYNNLFICCQIDLSLVQNMDPVEQFLNDLYTVYPDNIAGDMTYKVSSDSKRTLPVFNPIHYYRQHIINEFNRRQYINNWNSKQKEPEKQNNKTKKKKKHKTKTKKCKKGHGNRKQCK